MTKNLFLFDNSFIKLPEKFYRHVRSKKAECPALISFNQELAIDLGMSSEFTTVELAEIFSGNKVPEGAVPIAVPYAGHQFGHFVPELGDGRAQLLGEVISKDAIRYDIQLKGSGITPFSRGGDGRAALGPVVREYIVSEAMHCLGIPTTRALAAVTTGEKVRREEFLPGAVLTRVARSHIRVGTFEYFYSRDDRESLKMLADYVIVRLYPHLKESPCSYEELLQAVIDVQAKLVARWMQVGFIHGVINTDNMAISGETIDYGPCAFLDNYDPQKVFSAIDMGGRYAFNNQPIVTNWNLVRFAETLLALLHPDEDEAISIAKKALASFMPLFQKYWMEGMREKLGFTINHENDPLLINELLEIMQTNQADFTLTFRRLSDAAVGNNNDDLLKLFSHSETFQNWFNSWMERINLEPQSLQNISTSMRKINPLYIPRNHRIQQAITSAQEGDYSLMERLIHVLSKPFDDQKGYEEYANPPLESERVHRTFCGT